MLPSLTAASPSPPRALSPLPLPSAVFPFSQRSQLLPPSVLDLTASPASFGLSCPDDDFPSWEDPSPVDLGREAERRRPPPPPQLAPPPQLPPSPLLPAALPRAPPSSARTAASTASAHFRRVDEEAPLLTQRVRAPAPRPPPPPPLFVSRHKAAPDKPLLRPRRQTQSHTRGAAAAALPPPSPPAAADPFVTAASMAEEEGGVGEWTPPLVNAAVLSPLDLSAPPFAALPLSSCPFPGFLPPLPPFAQALRHAEDGGAHESLSLAWPAAYAPLYPPPPFPGGLVFPDGAAPLFPSASQGLPPPPYPLPSPFLFPPPLAGPLPPPVSFPSHPLFPPFPASHSTFLSSSSRAPPLSSSPSSASSSSSASSASPDSASPSPSPTRSARPCPASSTGGAGERSRRPYRSRRPVRRLLALLEGEYSRLWKRLQGLQHRQPFEAAEVGRAFKSPDLVLVSSC